MQPQPQVEEPKEEVVVEPEEEEEEPEEAFDDTEEFEDMEGLEENEEEFEDEEESDSEVPSVVSDDDEAVIWGLDDGVEDQEGIGHIPVESDLEEVYETDNEAEVRELSGPERESSDSDDL